MRIIDQTVVDVKAEFAAPIGRGKVKVAWHVKETRTRLHAQSRTHAVALAMRHDLLRDQPFYATVEIL
jgi:hypothetical protein